MSAVTINSTRATRFDWTGAPFSLEFVNASNTTSIVYYKYDSSVSSSSNDGSLTPGQSVTLSGTAWFLAGSASNGSTGWAVLADFIPPPSTGTVSPGSSIYVDAKDYGFLPTNTGLTNKANGQAAIDAGKGGTIYFPPGRYAAPLDNHTMWGLNGTTYNNTTLLFDKDCVLDASGAAGLFLPLVSINGTETARDVTGWQHLTAVAHEGDTLVHVVDASQFSQWDWIKIGSEERWDPGQRNQKVGELMQITSAPDTVGNTVSTSPGLAGTYYPNKRETTTPSTLTAGIDAVQTSIPVLNTDSYRQAQQNLPGIIKIDTEEISYTAKTDSTFEGCTRGANGTTAATHLSAATVSEVGNFTTLTAAMAAGDAAITVASTAGTPASTGGYIMIGTELIFYTSFTGTTFTGLLRGRGGTTAAAGNIGDRVYFADGAHIAKCTMVENVKVEGGYFLGPDVTQADNNTVQGIIASLTTNLVIKDTVFDRIKERCVGLTDCVRANVDGIHSFYADRNNFGYGVAILNACQDVLVHNCRFVKPRHGITHGGTFTTYGVCRRIHHENNIAFDTNNQSYDLHSSAGEDITFINCHAYNPSDAGFWVANASVDIINCSIIGTATTGIFGIVQNHQPVRIRALGNNFRNCFGGAGINISQEFAAGRPSSMNRIDFIQVEGNNVQGTRDYGIEVVGNHGFTGLSQDWPNVTVKGNNVDRCGNLSSRYSIWVQNVNGAVIQGNNVNRQPISNQAYFLRNVNKSVVNGNVASFRTLMSTGIDADTCTDTVFTGNVVRNGSNGILLGNACSNCTVQGNNLRGCTTPLTMGSGTGHISITTDNTGAYNRT